MSLIADILLAAGAIGAGFYCLVLGRRLNRFNDLEKGVGGAVAVLSAQVDDLTRTLAAAQETAGKSAKTLTDLTARAESSARKLELQMASLHDLPGEQVPTFSHEPAVEAAAAAPAPTAAPAPAEAKSAAETDQPANAAPLMFTRHKNKENAA